MPAGLAAALSALVLAANPAAAEAGECDVPAELMHVEAKLPHLAVRLHAGSPIMIVAIGGASTRGAAAGSPDLAYPHRLQEALSAVYPKITVTVVNKGVPRQTARQMVDRFPSDVVAEDPVLVIWEVGIGDAVQGVEPSELAGALQAGIDDLKNRMVDVILVDMQFSRSTTAIIDFERYLNTIHRIGDVNDVYVLPRFAMMRYWSEENIFNFDEVAKDERAKLAAKVYKCIGDKLAEAIRRAAE